MNKPGVYEVATGELLTDLIYRYAGGIPEDKKIKALIPGGSSTMILRGESIEGVRMDADSLKTAGSSVGTAGMIVMDEDTESPGRMDHQRIPDASVCDTRQDKA